MSKEKIHTLVVDDEAGIRFFIKEALQRSGHLVTTAANGEEAFTILRDTPFDLAILDLELGGKIDGLRILEAIRWRWPDTVVMILTAHGSLETAMAAIREKVDRYLLKPLTPQELRQAVKEAMAQSQSRESATSHETERTKLQQGPFTLDLQKHLAIQDGQVLDLTPSEFDLLVHLIRNRHRVVPPPELVQVVRDYKCEDLYEARQIIKWYIYRLRRKIEPDPAHPTYILNVRGVGYRFSQPATL